MIASTMKNLDVTQESTVQLEGDKKELETTLQKTAEEKKIILTHNLLEIENI